MNNYQTLQRALLCVFLLCVAALPSKAGDDATDMFEAYRNIIGTWKVDLSGGASLTLVIDERNIKETIKKPGKSDIVNVKNYSVSTENGKMIINTGSSKYFFNSSGLFGWDGTPFTRMMSTNPVSSNQNSPMKGQVQPKKDTKPQAESSSQAKDTQRKGEKESTKPKNPETKTESQKKAEQTVVYNNGNSVSDNNGMPSIGGGLKDSGYTLEYFPTAPCPGPGTVIISIVVRADGTVKSAKVRGGTLQYNKRACNICLDLARKSKFRVPKNTAEERSGTLIYTVK